MDWWRIVIELKNAGFTYDGKPIFANFSLEIQSGEVLLLAGITGSGKTTLLNTLANLAPDFTGGLLTGEIRRRDGLRSGFVQQSPADGFVASNVYDEIAFGLTGLTPATIKSRVHASASAVAISHLLDRRTDSLSGGEAQRLAIAAVLALEPDLLLLDEPTSALDSVAADEVLSLLQRLAHDHGIAVVFAEHRFDRAVQFADRLALITASQLKVGSPMELVGELPMPPVSVQLSRLFGMGDLINVAQVRKAIPTLDSVPSTNNENSVGELFVEINHCSVSRSEVPVLDDLNLQLNGGEIWSIFGRNGAGKSTFLHTLFGDLATAKGSVRVCEKDPATLSGSELVNLIAIVPQEPVDLLLEESLSEVFTANDKRRKLPEGSTVKAAATLGLPDLRERHPRQLSEGQRLLAALATIVASNAKVILLDEPTRGLDQQGRQILGQALTLLARDNRLVVVATHDLDWAAEVSTHAAVLESGRLVVNGSAGDVMTGSRLSAPSVARVFWPAPVWNLQQAREIAKAKS